LALFIKKKIPGDWRTVRLWLKQSYRTADTWAGITKQTKTTSGFFGEQFKTNTSYKNRMGKSMPSPKPLKSWHQTRRRPSLGHYYFFDAQFPLVLFALFTT
jgi:hypothetical protein